MSKEYQTVVKSLKNLKTTVEDSPAYRLYRKTRTININGNSCIEFYDTMNVNDFVQISSTELINRLSWQRNSTSLFNGILTRIDGLAAQQSKKGVFF